MGAVARLLLNFCVATRRCSTLQARTSALDAAASAFAAPATMLLLRQSEEVEACHISKVRVTRPFSLDLGTFLSVSRPTGLQQALQQELQAVNLLKGWQRHERGLLSHPVRLFDSINH